MSYKVLVVDDSRLARLSMAKMLDDLQPGWKLVEAANAEEALKIIKSEDADLALLDFNMPGRDGLILAADIRELKPLMPIAIVSANRQQEVLDRAAAVGAAFLAKPLSVALLKQFLSTAVLSLQAPFG